jgi:hypothetical protein
VGCWRRKVRSRAERLWQLQEPPVVCRTRDRSCGLVNCLPRPIDRWPVRSGPPPCTAEGSSGRRSWVRGGMTGMVAGATARFAHSARLCSQAAFSERVPAQPSPTRARSFDASCCRVAWRQLGWGAGGHRGESRRWRLSFCPGLHTGSSELTSIPTYAAALRYLPRWCGAAGPG